MGSIYHNGVYYGGGSSGETKKVLTYEEMQEMLESGNVQDGTIAFVSGIPLEGGNGSSALSNEEADQLNKSIEEISNRITLIENKLTRKEVTITNINTEYIKNNYTKGFVKIGICYLTIDLYVQNATSWSTIDVMEIDFVPIKGANIVIPVQNADAAVNVIFDKDESGTKGKITLTTNNASGEFWIGCQFMLDGTLIE